MAHTDDNAVPGKARRAVRGSVLLAAGLVMLFFAWRAIPSRTAITAGWPCAMVVFGVALGTVGADATTGYYRFVAMPELADGISLESLAMGLFGVSAVMRNAALRPAADTKPLTISMRDVIPTRAQARSVGLPILRGSSIGSFFEAFPGTGAAFASFMAYAMEKRFSRTPEMFWKVPSARAGCP